MTPDDLHNVFLPPKPRLQASDSQRIARKSATTTITPVLLCGGSGTRLWPLSRESYPKQFATLLGDKTLFQSAVERFRGDGFDNPLIVTSDRFRFVVVEQLAACEIDPAGILIEPSSKNTAPAALAAAQYLYDQDPDALLLLLPSDHAVADPTLFQRVVTSAIPAAEDGQIVTFGVKPTRPETGYGWLECGGDAYGGLHRLAQFIEKPDAQTAELLLKDDRHLWNTGVFLARADTLLAAYTRHAGDIRTAVSRSMAKAKPDLSFLRLDPESWENAPDISIDYAIMEHVDNICVARFDGEWTDLGSWQAVWQETRNTPDGNAISRNAMAIDCKNTLLRSESDNTELVGIGLENIVAIAMPDAVMVADLSESQNVKHAVTKLKAMNAAQATQLPIDHRPWGWFEQLVMGDRFQVKRIHVHPKASLSLQSHMHRSEHWVVVAGTAKVTIDDDMKMVSENQSVYIPLGAKHRLENVGMVPMVLIEIQTGSYLGEDDIIRYEDIYARG